MRPPLPSAAVALVAALLAGVGGAAAPPPTGAAPAVLAPLPLGAPAPTPAAVDAALAGPAQAAAFGGGLAGEVLDPATGTVLWSRGPDTPLAVASTQKLLVAAAALTVLGPATTPVTALRTAGTVSGGVLTGDLYLRGGGDVLLARTATDTVWPARTGLDALAAALAHAGIRTVRGALVADGTAFSGPTTGAGWKPSYVTLGSVAPVTALEVDRGTRPGVLARAGDPPLAAASDLRTALARAGVTVTGGTGEGAEPAGTRVLASVAGPPVAVGVQEMLENSDNDAAESYGRQLALATGRPPTFAGAAAAIVDVLSRAGLPTAGVALSDASGLSRLDRVTPRLLAAILRRAVGTDPAWRPILAGLPVADFSGTLTGRDSVPGDVAAGIVRAKTGNIDGVTSVAGTVVDDHGRQLVFQFVSDASQGLSATEAALDRLATALVGL